jgi:nucleoside-diphosphate-sugar epimerase
MEEEKKVKTILITGTTGYLGFILEKWLTEHSRYKIIPLKGRLENLEKNSLEADVVIHCAGALRYRASELKISNEWGTQKLIESFKNNPSIIYTSSKSVYGLNRIGLISEKDNPMPDEEYGKTKWEGEKIIQSSGLPFIILRLSGIYGEMYGRSGHCFPDQALRKYRNGEIVEVNSNKVEHEYIEVSKVCRVIYNFLNSNEGWNEVYNLSGQKEILENLIAQITHGKYIKKEMLSKEWIFLDNSKIKPFL